MLQSPDIEYDGAKLRLEYWAYTMSYEDIHEKSKYFIIINTPQKKIITHLIY